ncbi:MAG: imidazolonepropionase [Flavobacteriaceae bacterium]
MSKTTLIGPFSQILPMTNLKVNGPIRDGDLELIEDGGIVINKGRIEKIGPYRELKSQLAGGDFSELYLKGSHVCLPGFIDAHTHICYGGSRARDYAMRNAGKSYLEIAREGGGIWDTVTKTRESSEEELVEGIVKRAKRHLKNGVTTIEVKSGYGLSVEAELKMLRAIAEADALIPQDLIPTCLAAHICPRDFDGSPEDYLDMIIQELFPQIIEQNLCRRVDIFVEESAFTTLEAETYLLRAREMGFKLTVHADQFSPGGSELAVKLGAISADHLEASTEKEIKLLAGSTVIATALPGASLGLGCAFTPARRILDAGGALAIASDHNPGSGPMGDLLTQAAILGAFEKLSNAEVIAGITFRAAAALGLEDRGTMRVGSQADLAVFHTAHYNEILYNQGNLKPCMVWKNGQLAYDKHKM